LPLGLVATGVSSPLQSLSRFLLRLQGKTEEHVYSKLAEGRATPVSEYEGRDLLQRKRREGDGGLG
jgi:hypothetical protein